MDDPGSHLSWYQSTFIFVSCPVWISLLIIRAFSIYIFANTTTIHWDCIRADACTCVHVHLFRYFIYFPILEFLYYAVLLIYLVNRMLYICTYLQLIILHTRMHLLNWNIFETFLCFSNFIWRLQIACRIPLTNSRLEIEACDEFGHKTSLLGWNIYLWQILGVK